LQSAISRAGHGVLSEIFTQAFPFALRVQQKTAEICHFFNLAR
jgi:hypothetical protein